MKNLTSLEAIFNVLDIPGNIPPGGDLAVYSPIDGNIIACIHTDTSETISNKIETAEKAYHNLATAAGAPSRRVNPTVRRRTA